MVEQQPFFTNEVQNRPQIIPQTRVLREIPVPQKCHDQKSVVVGSGIENLSPLRQSRPPSRSSYHKESKTGSRLASAGAPREVVDDYADSWKENSLCQRPVR